MAMEHDLTRSRRERTARLRKRIAQIEPEDADMLELLGVLKGILDMIDDGSIVERLR